MVELVSSSSSFLSTFTCHRPTVGIGFPASWQMGWDGTNRPIVVAPTHTKRIADSCAGSDSADTLQFDSIRFDPPPLRLLLRWFHNSIVYYFPQLPPCSSASRIISFRTDWIASHLIYHVYSVDGFMEHALCQSSISSIDSRLGWCRKNSQHKSKSTIHFAAWVKGVCEIKSSRWAGMCPSDSASIDHLTISTLAFWSSFRPSSNNVSTSIPVPLRRILLKFHRLSVWILANWMCRAFDSSSGIWVDKAHCAYCGINIMRRVMPSSGLLTRLMPHEWRSVRRRLTRFYTIRPWLMRQSSYWAINKIWNMHSNRRRLQNYCICQAISQHRHRPLRHRVHPHSYRRVFPPRRPLPLHPRRPSTLPSSIPNIWFACFLFRRWMVTEYRKRSISYSIYFRSREGHSRWMRS